MISKIEVVIIVKLFATQGIDAALTELSTFLSGLMKTCVKNLSITSFESWLLILFRIGLSILSYE